MVRYLILARRMAMKQTLCALAACGILLITDESLAQQRMPAMKPAVSQPTAQTQRIDPGTAAQLNPQPYPPKGTVLSLQQLRALLKTRGTAPKVGPRVKNPALITSSVTKSWAQ
jgi:hypothetical protein